MSWRKISWGKRVMVGVIIALLLGVLMGASIQASANEDPEYTFYMVVHGGIRDPFWKVVEKGAKDADALLPEVKVVYTGPAEYDFEKFMSLVETSIAAGPDGLLVTITNYAPLDEPLRTAIKNKLPVIAINAKDPRPEDKRIPYLTYIGEDHYLVGETMAKRSMAVFKPKRAVFANHHPGAFHIEERAAGFIDTLKKAGIPAEEVNVTADPVKGADILIDYLKSHPDCDLVYPAATAWCETFMVRLLEEKKLADRVKVCMIDMSPKVLDYIMKDKILFTLDQQQYLQGYLSVMLMYLHVKNGFTPPSKVPTGPAIIDKSVIPTLRILVKEGIR